MLEDVIVVSLLLAAAVTGLAAFIERRLGPSAAGWVIALPAAIAVAVAGVMLDGGKGPAAAMALSVAAHVPAQVGLAVVFAGVLLRRGLVAGVAAGVLAYTACSIVLAGVPVALAVATAVVALVAAPRAMAGGRPTLTSPRHWRTTALTCAVSSVVVGTTVVVSRLAGPPLLGAVAAFPAVSMTLTVVIAARDGARAGAHALNGQVRSLPCYLTFCLIAAAVVPALGLAAVPLAFAGGFTAARVTWRGVPIARRAPRAPAWAER